MTQLNRILKPLHLLLIVLFCSAPLQKVVAQAVTASGTASFSNFSSPILESMTGFVGSSGTTSNIANWQIAYTGGTTLAGSNQSGGTTGGVYGNNNISFLGSGSASNCNATLRLRNTTGSTLTAFRVVYTARMWRSNTNSPTVSVTWSNSSSSSIPASGALSNTLTSLGFSDATSNISTGVTLSQNVTGQSIANNDYIFLRWIHTGGSSSDNLGWDEVYFIPEPTTQASAINFSSVSNNAMTINWTNGNGARRAVFVREATLGSITNPVDGTLYTASANWSSKGTELATSTGYYCVYDGTGNSVTLTNLLSGTPYYVQIFEYNSDATPTAATINYLTTTATNNPSNQATTGGCTTPSTQPSSFTSNTVTGTTANIAFTRGNGDGGVLIIARSGSAVSTSPTSGTTYTANSAFGSGDAIGSGFVVYNGTAAGASAATGNIALTGLTKGTTYHFAAYEYNSSGTCYNLTSPLTGNFTTVTDPSITTTVAASSITATGASSGGQTITAGGGNITAKGVVWNTTTSPTLPGAGSTNDGTGTANYTSTLSGLSAQTQYYARAYVTNEAATAYGSNISFYTLSAAPTVQASSLNATPSSFSQIDLSFTGATFPASGATQAGYVVIYATGTPTFTASNGQAPAAGVGTIVSTSATALPTTPSTSVNVTGLTQSTTYNFLVIPYTWDGTNASTYNYLTASAPTASATTNAGPSISVTGSSIDFGNIVTGTSSAEGNYTVSGSNLTADITITPPTGYEVATDPLGPYSSSLILNRSGNTVNSTIIYARFSPSSAAGTMSGNISHTSTDATTQNLAVSGKAISTEPTSNATGVSITNIQSTSFTITWTNGDGNNRVVLVKSSSAVDATPTDATNYTASTTFGSGTQVGTGNYIVFNGTGNSVTVTGLTNGTTYHVAVFEYNKNVTGSENYMSTSAIANGTCQTTTYYSQGSGDPAVLSNWNTNRAGGGSTPSSMTLVANYVIQNTHSMTTTGTLTIGTTGATLQIENGGTLTASHAITIASGATFQIDNGGTYIHNNTSAYGSTIFAGTESFGSTSNFELRTSNTTGPSGTFGNLTVNITSDPGGSVQCGGSITTINGNLRIQSVFGTREFRLSASTALSLTIGGDLTVESGILEIASSAGSSVARTINIGGNFTQSGGTVKCTGSSNAATINFTGSDKTFTQSAGTLTSTNINWGINSGASLTLASNIPVSSSRTIAVNGTLACSTFVVTGAGTVVVNNNGILKSANLSTSGALTASVTATGGITLNTGSTVELNGASAQYLAARTFHHLTLASPITVTLNGDITTNGTLSIGSTSTLDASTRIISFGSGGAITINGKFATANTNGFIGATNTAINNTNTPTVTLGSSSTIEYNSSSSQTVSTSTDYINVTISGNSTKTLAGTSTISGTLTLAGGTFDAANMLTVPTTGSIIHAGGTIINYTLPSTLANYTPPTGTNTLSTNLTVTGVLDLGSNTLDIGTNTLVINGTISRTSGTIRSNGGTITIGGSAGDATLYFDQTSSSTRAVAALNINRTGAIITLGNALDVNTDGTVTVTNGTLESSGNLTLLSTISGTGRIAELSGSANVTGTVNIQRWMIGGASSQRGWRTMSTPVTGATYAQLVDDIFVTGPGGSTNGFDLNGSSSSVMYYEESANRGWKSLSSVTDTWTPGKGALVFFRGDRTQTTSLSSTSVAPNSFALDFAGTINTGDINVHLDYNNTTGVADDWGWNLVGNPYPSQIDWSSINKTAGVDNNFYVLNPNTKNFVSQNTGIIASSQGFFVLVSGAGEEITFEENDKTASTGTAYFKTSLAPLTIKMALDSTLHDIAWLNFKSGASGNYVFKEDAKKMPNSGYNLSFISADGKKLQQNIVDMLSSNKTDTFVLNAISASNSTYTLQFSEFSTIPLTKNILLVDKLNNNQINLRVNPNYTFSIANSNPNSFGNRFLLIITDQYGALPVTLTSFNGRRNGLNDQIEWHTANEKNIMSYEVQQSSDGQAFKSVGVIKANNSSSSNSYLFKCAAQSGNTYYRLKINELKGPAVFSNTIVLTDQQTLQLEVSVKPNPVVDVLSVNTSALTEVQALIVYDASGNFIKRNSAQKQLDVSELKAGVYLLEVHTNQGIKTLKFVKL